ncbi:MAG: hypothetical protein IKU19_05040 [Clostridia bacterium]|nr:hypothetical protein [Clostridia bacterium]
MNKVFKIIRISLIVIATLALCFAALMCYALDRTRYDSPDFEPDSVWYCKEAHLTFTADSYGNLKGKNLIHGREYDLELGWLYGRMDIVRNYSSDDGSVCSDIIATGNFKCKDDRLIIRGIKYYSNDLGLKKMVFEKIS